MKETATLTDVEFQTEILEAIHREYGLGGVARFMTIFGSGKGDYTRDRHIWLEGITVEEITKILTAKDQVKAA